MYYPYIHPACLPAEDSRRYCPARRVVDDDGQEVLAWVLQPCGSLVHDELDDCLGRIVCTDTIMGPTCVASTP